MQQVRVSDWVAGSECPETLLKDEAGNFKELPPELTINGLLENIAAGLPELTEEEIAVMEAANKKAFKEWQDLMQQKFVEAQPISNELLMMFATRPEHPALISIALLNAAIGMAKVGGHVGLSEFMQLAQLSWNSVEVKEVIMSQESGNA
jgi:hypothetical protein